jgi:hypothetical protein
MGLLVLASAASFACLNPTHHDGDAIRCACEGRSMRLYGIDAPEMPGACRPGRQCTLGDPYAARDYLAGLTAGRTVTCEQVDSDDYGRRVVRCAADSADLSCAMVAGGHAVERYGRLGCGAEPSGFVPQPPAVKEVAPVQTPAEQSCRSAPASRTLTVLVPRRFKTCSRISTRGSRGTFARIWMATAWACKTSSRS